MMDATYSNSLGGPVGQPDELTPLQREVVRVVLSYDGMLKKGCTPHQIGLEVEKWIRWLASEMPAAADMPDIPLGVWSHDMVQQHIGDLKKRVEALEEVSSQLVLGMAKLVEMQALEVTKAISTEPPAP